MESLVNDVLAKAKERESLYMEELRKQIRCPETYLDQIGNFLIGLARFSGWWIALTTVYTSVVVLLAFMFSDFTTFSYPEIQKGLRTIVIFCGGVSALACLFSNTGKFRNIFNLNALDHVDRYQNIKKEVESQIKTTDGLLLKYGLINQVDIEKRKSESKQWGES